MKHIIICVTINKDIPHELEKSMRLKSDMMTYNSYKAAISYDKDDKIFIGEEEAD